MTYPYPANIIPIAEEVISRIQAAGATFSTPVDPSNVYYGDQDRIPATPSICIDPGDKTRSLAGAPNMTLNEFEIYVIIYHNKIQEMQLTRKEADQLAYEVEFMLHQDLQLKTNPSDVNSGLLIHGFVNKVEPGYTTKANTTYRSTRLTYYGQNKTSLPTA